VGGIATAADESGDARRFAEGSPDYAARCTFRWNTTIEALAAEGDAIVGAPIRAPRTAPTRWRRTPRGCAGGYSPFLLRPLAVPCPIYPAKGYSATIDGRSPRAPTVSLTDLAAKTMTTRLGAKLHRGHRRAVRLRPDLNPVRCEALVARTFELFPDAGERASRGSGRVYGRRHHRTCRSSAARSRALLDTGHGTLGWTMACGSDAPSRISSRAARLDRFAFTAP
jgi:D-amino-acid dehydrogenase